MQLNSALFKDDNEFPSKLKLLLSSCLVIIIDMLYVNISKQRLPINIMNY